MVNMDAPRKKFTRQKGLIIAKCESQLKVESMCKTTKFEIIKIVRTIDGPPMSKDTLKMFLYVDIFTTLDVF